ncbi:MAG: hypothetical protein AAF658_06480 [Myxococcota bacterium]
MTLLNLTDINERTDAFIKTTRAAFRDAMQSATAGGRQITSEEARKIGETLGANAAETPMRSQVLQAFVDQLEHSTADSKPVFSESSQLDLLRSLASSDNSVVAEGELKDAKFSASVDSAGTLQAFSSKHSATEPVLKLEGVESFALKAGLLASVQDGRVSLHALVTGREIASDTAGIRDVALAKRKNTYELWSLKESELRLKELSSSGRNYKLEPELLQNIDSFRARINGGVETLSGTTYRQLEAGRVPQTMNRVDGVAKARFLEASMTDLELEGGAGVAIREREGRAGATVILAPAEGAERVELDDVRQLRVFEDRLVVVEHLRDPRTRLSKYRLRVLDTQSGRVLAERSKKSRFLVSDDGKLAIPGPGVPIDLRRLG